MSKEIIAHHRRKFNAFISEELNGLDLHSPDLYRQTFVNIYYRREPTFHVNPQLLSEHPDATIAKDYVHVVSFWMPNKDETAQREMAFQDMQGENWSPYGQARELIRYLGLKHTSMSVGDIIEFTDTGSIYECAPDGWRRIQ